MLPRCWMSARCWRKTVRELDRTAPAEGVAVPLIALSLRDPDANPCAPVELEAVAEVGIAAVLLVPPDLQVNRAAHVRVRPATDRVLNRRIERITERFPRLRTGAYLHSHPFALGSTWPSRGPSGDEHGHMIPLLERNREAGLNASFSFIACRGGPEGGWAIQAFALGRRREILDLGFVEVLADDAPRVHDALRPALHRRADARALLDRWCARLVATGRAFAIDDLFGGWVRIVVRVDLRTSLVALVPLELPERPLALYRVDRAAGACSRIGAPREWLDALPAGEDASHVGS